MASEHSRRGMIPYFCIGIPLTESRADILSRCVLTTRSCPTGGFIVKALRFGRQFYILMLIIIVMNTEEYLFPDQSDF